MRRFFGSLTATGLLCVASWNAQAQLGELGDLLEPVSDALQPVTAAVLNSAEGILPTGYFESYNAYWGQPPVANALSLSALHYDATQRAVDASNDYVSISYFPQSDLQISKLEKMGFDLLPMTAGACVSGSVRAEILINSNASDQPRVRTTLKAGVGCAAGRWNAVDLVNKSWVDWSSTDGQVFAKRGDAHRWAKQEFGSDYKIWGIRIQFLGYNGFGPDAWIDNVHVNASVLREAVEDFGFYANFGEDDVSNLLSAGAASGGTGIGWFQSTKNVRWNLPDRFSPVGGEALQYAPRSRTGDHTADAMSVSYYVQDALQVADLDNLSAYYYPRNGNCAGLGTPYFWVIMSNSAGTQTRDAFVKWTGQCSQGVWRELNYLGRKAEWAPGHIMFDRAVNATREDLHAAALEDLGPDYQITTIRFVQESPQAEVWVDGIRINHLSLNERLQDWSPTSQVPAALVQSDGFVSLIEFPKEQLSVDGTGAVVLIPDANGRIVANVTPYLDGDRDYKTNQSIDQDHVYETGGVSPNDLILSFYDVSGQQSFTFTSNPELRPPVVLGDGVTYKFVLDLPAGFSGGLYTVVATHIGDHGNSYDNRGSYYFLGKELLLKNGGADVAHIADLMDTPEQFLHVDDSNIRFSPEDLLGCKPSPSGDIADQQSEVFCYPYYNSFRRGYEGPRSPVVIVPR
ncbi:hypothetical protein ATO7_04650 [Oceanococcus atlanticus]|uniref:Uncharacterized protein n=1 Tax=Oceanococcus atlanticus TaxID=1317117 RepID=A0A1Y1SIW2_9GAMM|nr:hypothetical protein [Oceanococcus atlanticus]ORE89139.1 hypothetical protein ATO7_04650 [Oceanococcus atlanticus]